MKLKDPCRIKGIYFGVGGCLFLPNTHTLPSYALDCFDSQSFIGTELSGAVTSEDNEHGSFDMVFLTGCSYQLWLVVLTAA